MSITIKMERDKLILKLDEGKNFSEQKDGIAEYLKKMAGFLAKSNVKIAYEGAELNFYEEMELCELLDDVFGCKTKFCYKNHPPTKLMRHILSGGEQLSLSVRRTVRGGEKISSNGDLTVIGDVNPAAELEAVGNIYVLGNFRGRACAGMEGDKSAVIFALKMDPEQITIADITAFNPKTAAIGEASFAMLKDNEIVITNL